MNTATADSEREELKVLRNLAEIGRANRSNLPSSIDTDRHVDDKYYA